MCEMENKAAVSPDTLPISPSRLPHRATPQDFVLLRPPFFGFIYRRLCGIKFIMKIWRIVAHAKSLGHYDCCCQMYNSTQTRMQIAFGATNRTEPKHLSFVQPHNIASAPVYSCLHSLCWNVVRQARAKIIFLPIMGDLTFDKQKMVLTCLEQKWRDNRL